MITRYGVAIELAWKTYFPTQDNTMPKTSIWKVTLSLVSLIAIIGCSQTLRYKDNIQGLRQVKRKLLVQKRPLASKNLCVENVAREIDWLEHHLETYGTVVPKQPDVWGESRLTKYRHDVEKQLEKQLVKFEPTLQGSIRRSDTSALAMALAVDSVETGTSDVNAANNAAVTLIGEGGLIPSIADVAAANATNRAVDFKLTEANKNQISLEPTIHLDQMKRYLDHLNELRRINNGDDTADSPGYALHMVRIPVSVMPGHRTRTGYGAEISLTAKPIIGDELLPSTFRDLVINDIQDRLTLPIANVLSQLTDEQLAFIDGQMNPESEPGRIVSSLNTPEDNVDPENVRFYENWSLAEGGNRRRSRFGFPTTHLHQVYGAGGFNTVLKGAVHLRRTHVGRATGDTKVVHMVDVRGYLAPEINAAFDFLCQPQNQHLWDTFCTPELAQLIHTRNVEGVRDARHNFYNTPGVKSQYEVRRWATTSLAWAILAESAILNEQLKKEIRDLYSKKGLGRVECDHLSFVGPRPSDEARQVFNDYVAQRWPIQVFALDPVTQDQNIADEFSRRRELQLAMAVSVARGTMSGAAAARFSRRLEADIRTIALNKTHVAFSHGNDTFGWRFSPRVQSPPTSPTVQAITETFGGGPTPDQDMRDRQLEPGIRECTALIVMPSFVSYASFESRTNWFGLTNPRKKELTMHDTMKLSRSHHAIHQALTQATDCDQYRPVDVAQLDSVVQQLDRRMPLQCMTVQIPYENTMGGFEMFNSGIADLGPQLDGWYGAPGIRLGDCDACDSCTAKSSPAAEGETAEEDATCKCSGTTLFLVGENFSVQDTRVIAGGKCIPEFTLLSRNVIQVVVPPGAHPLVYHDRQEDGSIVHQRFVDIHLATPYGVSSHLLVPVHTPHPE